MNQEYLEYLQAVKRAVHDDLAPDRAEEAVRAAREIIDQAIEVRPWQVSVALAEEKQWTSRGPVVTGPGYLSVVFFSDDRSHTVMKLPTSLQQTLAACYWVMAGKEADDFPRDGVGVIALTHAGEDYDVGVHFYLNEGQMDVKMMLHTAEAARGMRARATEIARSIVAGSLAIDAGLKELYPLLFELADEEGIVGSAA